MKNSMRFIVLSLFVLCFGITAFAQTATTGSIEGMVMDQNQRPVANATVTATSPNLILAQTAQTNDAGQYSIANLPPGTYTVTVEETAGFAKKESTGVIVNLSKTTTIDLALTPKGAQAEVTITDTGAAVDVTSATSGSNVSSDQFSNFPTARTVQGLYTIAPSVGGSGLRDASGRERDPSVAGSSGPENNYILDGVNTSDPAFGGAGANLPFEFVQEVEIKTGAYGADIGRSTGGVFNVITKSGGNEINGDVFGYFTTKGMVRDVKSSAVPLIGASPQSFSEIDAGVDIGGPIKKDKLWFFGAFNPQRRKNQFLTQTFLEPVENKITTPFYAGKLTWGINQNNTFTFSTFGDFTKQEGFLFRLNARVPDNGFGANLDSFRGTIETGGHNYVARLNSNIRSNFIGEFMFGLHYQRANTIPASSVADVPLLQENFAVVRNGSFVTPVDTNVFLTTGNPNSLRLAFVDGRGGGGLFRNFTTAGFGLVSDQDRNRWEFAARLQNIWGQHTIKYGFEYMNNSYKILTKSSGPGRTFGDPFDEEADAIFPATNMPGGVRITNRWGVCAPTSATAVVCPSAAFTGRLQRLIDEGQGPAGITSVTTGSLTIAQLNTNPILVLSSVRVRDFFLNTGDGSTSTRVQGFYVQDDFKIQRNLQLNLGLRWDYQQAYGTSSSYIKLNNFIHNTQPRIGFIWDFTGQGRGKVFVNVARFLETPIPLDVNVRAGGDDIQLDRHANVNFLNAAAGTTILAGTASGLGCLGCEATPVDPDLRPQTVNEAYGGIEYEVVKDFTVGFAGRYRAQDHVIEDGSFDDGAHYFLFNPGSSQTERLACADPLIGCFGRARRYYRALEFTATKRFTHNYQFIGSYVYSSLIGNYEGLFRNDNGQSDPNITSLFDLPSLLGNTYGRLPNDRPHQFKFNGSYRTPFKLMVSGNFYYRSGIPFDALIPHPVYGDNEGFEVPRGSAVNPITGSDRTPSNYQLDLGAYYPIKTGEKSELRFMVDWFNVTNAQRAIREDTTLRINSGISGVPPVANPTFGTGTIFQFPSTLRLGAKFSF
ncbi:MAG TPA: TonB-dependent receptor [Pyrinomonadaceae bacterium]|nr:TonB-dependent receptor [Pyrinomonadaceae bacterium]HKZ79106.1 TonB-dependent receptor [Pyrinomonadaceae bacterium]